MNLLDLYEGREPHQQAIDRLEQARIDHLKEKMDYYAKHGMAAEFRKAKAEHDSYHRVADECMGYGSVVGEAGIGQDIVNRTEKMARATPSTPASKVSSTVKNAAKWLAGKGGPGREGPTYEGRSDFPDETEHEYNNRRNTSVNQSQKKNSEDPKLARLKTRARHDHPQASTDDEALALHILDKEQSDVDQLSRENEREERMIAQLRDVEQNLQQQIDNLTSATVDEGWSDAVVAQRTGRPRTPYSVYIKGRKWKDFENDDHAEAVANKLRAKFKQEGRDPSVITIAPTDYDKGMAEGFFPGMMAGGRDDNKKSKAQSDLERSRNEKKQAAERAKAEEQDRAWWKTQGKKDVDEAISKKDLLGKLAKDSTTLFKKAKAGKLKSTGKDFTKGDHWTGPDKDDPSYTRNFGHGYPDTPDNRSHDRDVNKSLKKGVAEDQEDDWYDEEESNLQNGSYVVDTQDPSGEVFRVSQYEPGARRCWIGDRDGRGWYISPDRLEIVDDPDQINRYFGKKRDLDEDQDTSGVESAIIRRIMVAHTDLLKQFGPEKVMQAAEEVAYNVGDVDEIGSSDVSAYVNQVKQILGAE